MIVAINSACITELIAAQASTTSDFSAVETLFNHHCLDCHAAQDPEGKLVLEDFASLMKGGDSGLVVVPGKSSDSLLVKMLEGNVEKDGKKKIMPPGKRKKLQPGEIAIIKAWIDAGAKPPATVRPKELVVPKITPKVAPRKPINALAYAPGPKLVAVARYGEVELRSIESRAVTRTMSGHRGNVNAVVFSADGSQLFAAAGETALFGEVRQWKVADGSLVRVLQGHKDSLYAVALSPDGKTLATGGYDQKIKLWKVETGEEIKTLSGHNGAVFDLAFRPDGKILASVSADRTVKLWEVATGERRDTLAQPLKEQYTLAFSRDGKRLLAGGVDNRIRVWQISETAAETTNPLLYSRFAHEGAILQIVYSADGKSLLSSADDRTVKIWDADEVKERLLFEKQSDWPPAITFAAADKMVVVGRLDGTLGFYDSGTGKAVPPTKPDLSRIEPRGIQRGAPAKIKLLGSNLIELTDVKFQSPKLKADILREGTERTNEAWVEVTAAADLARGVYELAVANAGGESGKLKLYVDDLPQAYESESNRAPASMTALTLPVSFWGTLDPMGDADEVDFEAGAGQTLVFDLAARSIGSKASAAITLLDAKGDVLGISSSFDGGDPLLTYKIPAKGRYRVRINEETAAGSKDHFYRLAIGSFPMVVGCYPLSVPPNAETDVELVGFNLPASPKVKIKAGAAGEVEVPTEFRSRRTFKVLVGDGKELIEIEPNDGPQQAMTIPVPCAVNGRITPSVKGRVADVDLFRFEAKAGQKWIIETMAAQRGSPMDTKIEILHADGRPVERLLLQGVRNTAINFRGIDSNGSGARLDNWEEMELNEYLYMQGEVMRLFRMPQGPDSDMLFYTAGGKRRAFFDTSPTAHALDEPGYIIEPHPPGTKLPANGLPVFTLYYANDDDSERKLGTDSTLLFTAPAEGVYLVRVTDTRAYIGERFAYRLVVREPKPDFKVTLNGANPTVNAGSGQSFGLGIERTDGFDEDVRVEVSGLPPGFIVSTPLVIQAGQSEAKGTIYAALDAPKPDETNSIATKIVATAVVNGREVSKEINNLGKIKLGDKPKLFVSCLPADRSEPITYHATNTVKPLEITVAPGQSVPAWLKIKRNGHEDLVTFSVENLPYGVIVDNIGLNGVLIPKGENEREIFIAAARWVPEMDRLCFAIENQVGRQTSLPVLLHVRKPAARAAASGK